jgi:hypothetical protein
MHTSPEPPTPGDLELGATPRQTDTPGGWNAGYGVSRRSQTSQKIVRSLA